MAESVEKFDVDVVGTVRAPVDRVWALFRPFGPEIMGWWPIYEWVKLEAPAKDGVGCVRAFHTKTGRTYREKLVARDDAAHTETYSLLSVEPSVPTLTTIETRVSMTGQGDHTIVRWSSRIDAGGLFKGRVMDVQTEVYTAAIKSLDAHFHPSLGSLRIKVVAARDLAKTHGLLPPDPYVVAQLDGGFPGRSAVRWATAHPHFGDEIVLDVLSLDGRLDLSVWDACLGADALLGSVEVDLHTLTSGKPARLSLELKGRGTGLLDVTLELALAEGGKLGFTEEVTRVHAAEHLQDIVDKVGSQVLAVAQQLAKGHEDKYGYARYGRNRQIPEVPLEDLPRMAAGLPADEVMTPEKLGRMVQRGIEYGYSEVQFGSRLATAKDPFEAYFADWVKRPSVASCADDDRELSRQLVQGVNPHMIKLVRAIDEVPSEMRQLTAGTAKLTDLISAKRLFICDYPDLAALKPYRDMVFYAPTMLVYREENAPAPALDILGIRLGREANSPVMTRQTTPPNRWRLAKLHVACADNQYHQWLEHLGYGHLAMEPFAVATHDALPAAHPIAELLKPHFRDTIGINFLARQTLVSDIAAFTDRTFSTGTAQALQMFLGAWKKFDFGTFSFPERLAARGFDEAGSDGLAGYLYREDGFAIWNALDRYVGEVVDATYANDAAVAADAGIRAWASECADPARAAIPGFPAEIATRALLRKTLSTIVFQVSAGHSAVNYPQYDYLSYVPNRPDSMFKPMPEGTGEIDVSYLRAALPNEIISHFQISFAYLLTLPAEQPLTAISGVSTRYPDIHRRFQAHLAEVAQRIHARDAALVAAGRPPYPYLAPDRVAASIAI